METVVLSNLTYKETDALLLELYPTDMDIVIYEGVLVDNMLGYMPTYQNVTYQYLIVEETYENSQSSLQTVTLTNDDQLFQEYYNKWNVDLND